MFEQEKSVNSKYRKIFWSVLLLVNIAVFALLLLAGYGGKDYSANQKEHSYLIGVSYIIMNIYG